MFVATPLGPVRIAQVGVSAEPEIRALRRAVWVREGLDREIVDAFAWWDAADEAAQHWVAEGPTGQILAAARVSLHHDFATIPYATAFPLGVQDRVGPGPWMSWNRLVVDPSVRGCGIAKALDESRLTFAGQTPARAVLSVTSGRRLLALESQGFRDLGPTHQVPGLLRLLPESRVMCRSM